MKWIVPIGDCGTPLHRSFSTQWRPLFFKARIFDAPERHIHRLANSARTEFQNNDENRFQNGIILEQKDQP
jgi:hypothetical protein